MTEPTVVSSPYVPKGTAYVGDLSAAFGQFYDAERDGPAVRVFAHPDDAAKVLGAVAGIASIVQPEADL